MLPLPQQPGHSSAGISGVQCSRLSQHQDGETGELANILNYPDAGIRFIILMHLQPSVA